MANTLLSKNQYQLINDVFNSANTNIYLNDFHIADAVTFQYRYISQKSPIYSYASEFFTKVAPGTVIVDGILGVIYTETGYFEAMRQAIMETLKKQTEAKEGYISDLLMSDNGVPNDTLIGGPVVSYKTTINTINTNNLRIYGATNQHTTPGISPYGGYAMESPYVRHMTIEDYLGQTAYNEYTYENWVEAMEDTIWGSPNALSHTDDDIVENIDKGFAEWDPYSIRIRNEMEMDYKYLKLSDGYIRSIMSTTDNPFTFYITYGDTNTPAQEHTVESIDDVHFRDRQISIDNDGQGIIAIYSFFGRTINSNINQKFSNYTR